MVDADDTPRANHGIAFVGNYLPRKCGIATFTYDLAEAVAKLPGEEQSVSVCAMNDTSEGYDYPDRVKFEVRQDFPGDYSRAADFLNFSQADVVSLQHEFGIFGGEAGANVLTLLGELRRPIVVTCHTVLKEPKPAAREVFIEIAAHARKLVVMSKKAFGFLEDVYKVPKEKITHIPHGIHDVPFIDPSYYKDKFGVEGRKVMLTFGLLSPNKGIENVIEALPAVVAKHPKVIYVVLGTTHPNVVREEGESYRLGLQRRVRELEMEEHVLFLPKFVDIEDLLEYIGASDIFVTPYHNLDQITSGVLSYAMGAGKAVISTPYWHAEELLAEGRGKLFSPGDSDKLAAEINSLLDDEVGLAAMRKRAYAYCRNMIWPSVARSYRDLFNEARSYGPTNVSLAAARRKPLAVTDLPVPKLDHVLRLSDDTGIAHHARRKLPDFTYGYWMQDAAEALVATVKYFDALDTDRASRLCERYLSLLQHMIGNGDEIVGRLDYSRKPVAAASEADIGKAIWACGYAVSHGPPFTREYASDVFNELVPRLEIHDFRGSAYAILGAADYLLRFDGASTVRRYLQRRAFLFMEKFMNEQWLDDWNGSDIGVAPQALAVAARSLGSEQLEAASKNIATQLMALTEGGKIFPKLGDNPDDEELPVVAMSFIEALGALYHLSHDRMLLKHMRAASEWFLGANRRNEALYDFTSGGCHDALTGGGLNQNQGTEATLACLISFLTLHQLIGVDRET
ncbi:MAG: glycosyltransferase family 4 protein [Myxococcota bacterium]|nr:glycosyltransferase family 4 protein [Myxococcota bacterium]